MAYTKKTWEDRTVERPLTYILQDNGDGTHTLIPSEGSILATGTPITASNMNNIEDGIANAHTDIATANGRIDTANTDITTNSGLITGLRTDVDTINTYPKIVEPNGSVPRFEDIDMNTLNKTGWYLVNNAINRPPVKGSANPENWFYVQVISHDDLNYIVQIAYDYTNGVFLRRRHWLNTGFIWTSWISPNTEGKQLLFATHTGKSLVSGTWTRVTFTSLIHNYGGMYVSGSDVFNIYVSGFYRVAFRGTMNHSVGTKIEVQFWQIGGAATKAVVLDGYAMNNGWNVYYAEEPLYLNAGETWEFVARVQDGTYTRTLYPKCVIEKI